MREGAAVFSGSALLEPRLGDVGALGTQRATFVAGIGVAHVTGSAVYISSAGQLGELASCERYKTDIRRCTPAPQSCAACGQ